MHTEDDTFRILSRPSFGEMKTLYQEWWRTETNSEMKIEFMKKHNWTWLEFVLEARNRQVGDKL